MAACDTMAAVILMFHVVLWFLSLSSSFISRVQEILMGAKDGDMLKKVLNPHFGKLILPSYCSALYCESRVVGYPKSKF
jgi:hypothetical protein